MTTTPEPERDFTYVMTGPEIELVEVVRLAHMADFSLAVEHQGDAFLIRLTNTAASRFLEGRGPTFEAAWRALKGSDPSDLDLDLRDRIASRGRRVASHLTLVKG